MHSPDIRDLSVLQLCMLDLRRFSRFTTPDEQILIARTYRLGGKIEDRNLLVMTGVMWALKLAHTFSRQYGCHRFFPDLVQEAMIGLIRAAEMFDPELGFRFSTYATSHIRQKMVRYIMCHAEDIRLPVHRIHKLRKYYFVLARLKEKLGREPTDEEVIAAGYEDKDLRTIRKGGHYAGTVSLSAPAYVNKDGDALTLLDLLADPKQADDILKAASDLVGDKLAAYVRAKFKPKIAESFIGYYGLGTGSTRTLEEVGRQFGVTREMVRQRIEKVQRASHFRWFAAKIFFEGGMLHAPSLDELRSRLEQQDRLAREAASVPAIPELRRPKRVNGSSPAPETLTKTARRNRLAEIPENVLCGIQVVISGTERHYGLPAGHLAGPSQNRQVAYARKVAAQLIREKTGLSWDVIGAVFNRTGANFNTASLEMRRNFQENPQAWNSFQAIKTSVMEAIAS